jgi:hypothetical protein
MIQEGKLYYVLPTDMAQELDYNALEEMSYTEVRKSVDGTMAIVEYAGQIAVRGGSYLTYDEAFALMQTAEWTHHDEGMV